MPVTTRPCESCGVPVSKTGKQQSQRKYWTCSPSCANKRRIQLGNTPGWAPNPLRGQKDTRPCAFCSKPVTRYLSQRRADQVWTCSRTCAATLRGRSQIAAGTWNQPRKPRTGDTIPCATCGTPFYRQPAYIKQGRRFCSTTCHNVQQTKPVTIKACVQCGAEISVKPSQSHRQFCSKRCEADQKIARPVGRMHNGRPAFLNAHGYVMIYEPEHPAATKTGRVLEHRRVVEQAIGRYLKTEEQVDHINQDKADNRLENLQVLDASSHSTKTNAENLGALQVLRAQMAAYIAKYGPLD